MSTGTTRTHGRTTARRWVSTATSWSSPGNRTTGRPRTESSSSPSTTSCWRTAPSPPSAGAPRPIPRWAASATSSSSPARPSRPSTRAPGEVVRLYLTNTANTRVFNVALPGARMKLVGGDSGRVEHEEPVESVIVAPSERVVIDVLVEEPGDLTLEHRTPERTYRLAGLSVAGEPASPSCREQFEELRRDPELAAERARLARRPRGGARQDGRPGRRDGPGRPRGRGPHRLRLPDAPRRRQRHTRPLSPRAG